jgi:hypothetical protein
MPGGDRTGPSGEGQKTGRGLGICAGYDEPGYATPRGFGRGRGFRFGSDSFQTPDPAGVEASRMCLFLKIVSLRNRNP